MWSDVGFNAIQFIGSYLPFSEKFPGDYKALQYKSYFALIGMKDNLLLRTLILEDVEQRRRYQAKKELMEKLKKYDDGYKEI